MRQWTIDEGGTNEDVVEVLALAIAIVEVLMEATIQADALAAKTQAVGFKWLKRRQPRWKLPRKCLS